MGSSANGSAVGAGAFFSYERSLEKHVCTMDKSRRGTAPYQVAPKLEQPNEH